MTSTNIIRWLSRHRDWSPQTRATVAGSVRSWLRWAADNLDADVPAAASIPVAHIPVRRRYRNVEDPRVVSALIRSTPTTSLMILLARDAGLRRAEIAQIHARDLLCRCRLPITLPPSARPTLPNQGYVLFEAGARQACAGPTVNLIEGV